MFVRFLLVFDLLFILFRVSLWPSAGKELSPWLFSCVVFIFSAVLVVRVPYPFGVWSRMWNSVAFLATFFIRFERLGLPDKIVSVTRFCNSTNLNVSN